MNAEKTAREIVETWLAKNPLPPYNKKGFLRKSNLSTKIASALTLAVEEERERAAKVAEQERFRYQWGCGGTHYGIGTPECPSKPHHHHDDRCAHPAIKIAKAIRNGGKL